MNGKSQNTIKEKLVGLFVNNETVYRTWRTFLQAAAGVLAPDFRTTSWENSPDALGKGYSLFYRDGSGGGVSAVMNRSEKNKSDAREEAKEKAEREEAAPLFPRGTAEGKKPPERENAESERERQEMKGEKSGENG